MTTHVELEGQTGAACREFHPGDVVVSWAEANNPDDRPFDCVRCHKVLTGGQRHSRPDGDAR